MGSQAHDGRRAYIRQTGPQRRNRRRHWRSLSPALGHSCRISRAKPPRPMSGARFPRRPSASCSTPACCAFFSRGDYGGWEMDWGTQYYISKEIAHGCPSTAWVVSVVGPAYLSRRAFFQRGPRRSVVRLEGHHRCHEFGAKTRYVRHQGKGRFYRQRRVRVFKRDRPLGLGHGCRSDRGRRAGTPLLPHAAQGL